MDRSEGLDQTASAMVDAAYRHWNNHQKLKDVAIKIIDCQLILAGKIASAESTENVAFMEEYEQSFKKNVTIARAKAKSLAGNIRTKCIYEFEALKGLLSLVKDRIKELNAQQAQLPPEAPDHQESSALEPPTTKEFVASEESESTIKLKNRAGMEDELDNPKPPKTYSKLQK